MQNQDGRHQSRQRHENIDVAQHRTADHEHDHKKVVPAFDTKIDAANQGALVKLVDEWIAVDCDTRLTYPLQCFAMAKPVVFRGQLILPERIERGSLRVRDGRIEQVLDWDSTVPADAQV